jgi:hypothetical protein
MFLEWQLFVYPFKGILMNSLICITLVGLLLGLFGCGAMHLDQAEVEWNSQIGHTKDELIKENGPPESCATLKSGEEVCAWVRRGERMYVGGNSGSGSTWEHRIIYTFNTKGMVTGWSYKGSWGERRSK